jgi:PAS domain S-box-containing protein
MGEKLRKPGITVLGNVPWGTHLCLFYQTKEDLIDILVPYFKTGLENNEFCMWVTSEPLKAAEAKTALKKAVKNLDNYIKEGQIEILDASQWYTKTGKFKTAKVLEGWVAKQKQALEKGFDGLRLTGNTFWLEKRDWKNFTDYEKEVDDVIHKHQMIALCSYSLDKCGASEIIDVVDNHQYALIKRRGKWELLERGKCKRVEEARRESEEKFRNLAEQSPNMIFINKKGRVVYANQKCEEIMGYKREEFYSPDFNFLTLMAPESLDLAKASFSKHIKGEDVAPYECILITKKGKRVTAIITTKLIQYNGDNAILGILTDITERKQAEEVLKISEENYKTIFENLPFVGLTFDRKGRLLEANKRAEEITGLSLKDFKGKSFSKFGLLGKRDLFIAFTEFRKNLQGKVTDGTVYHPKIKDGREILLELVGIPIKENGEVKSVLVVGDDITERKQAVEALKVSERKYKDLVKNLSVGVYRNTPGPKGKFIEVNPAIVKIFGYDSREEFLRLNVSQLYQNPGARKEFNQKMKKDGLVKNAEIKLKRKDGTTFWGSVTAVAIRDGKGKIKYYDGIIEDITERKHAAEELKYMHKIYHETIENAQGVPYRLNYADNTYEFIGEGCEELLGIPPHELTFGKLRNMVKQIAVVDPKSPSDPLEYIRAFRRGKLKRYQADLQIVTPTGDTKWVSDCSVPILDEKKESVIGSLGILQDITERKRTEEALTEANARLQTLQEATAAVHSTLDLEKVFRRITDGIVYSMGYTTAFIVTLNDEKKHFEMKALSTEKRLLPQVDKILGSSIRSFSFSVDAELNDVIRSAMKGKVVVSKTLAEIVYPLISKGACAALQKLRRTKNYILVPLEAGKEIVGGIVITSSREEVSEEELKTIKTFAHAASSAIENAKLHMQTNKAKEALRESEERYRSIVEHSHAGILILDEAYRLTYVNDELCRIAEYPREELIGQDFRKFLDDESLELVTDYYIRRQKGEKVPSRYELSIIRKGGDRRHVEVSSTVIKDSAGKVRTVTQILDITERKQAEEALAHERDLLYALMDNIPDTIYYKDTACRFTRINRAQAKALGVNDPKKAIGKTDFEFFDKEHAQNAYADEQKIMRTGQPLINKIEKLRMSDGQFHWFSATKVPITDDNGQVAGMVGISRDVTGLKQAEDALKQRNQELATLNAINTAVSQSLDLDEILNAALGKVLELMHLDAGAIYLADLENYELNLVVHRGISKEFAQKIKSIRVDQKTVETVKAEGKLRRFILSAKVVMKARTELKRILSAIKKEGLSLDSGGIVLLQAKDKIVGLITVASRTPRQFSKKELQLLTSISQQIAVAIDNAKLYEDEQRRTRQLGLINQLDKRITSILDSDELLQESTELIHETFGYYYVSIFLVEPGTNDLVLKVEAGNHDVITPKGFRQPMDVGMLGLAARLGESILANDVSKEPSYVAADLTETKSELDIPIKYSNKMLGVLDLQSKKLNAFDDRDIAVFETLADQIAVAIENARLYESAQKEITERKQAEEALAESEHEKAIILDSLSEIVIYHDKELRVIWVNRAASASAGVLPGQLKGRHCYEIWQQRSEPCRGCPVLKTFKTGRPQRAEMTASGKVWLVKGYPIRDANGEIMGAVEVTQDITERKRTEEQIKASLKEKDALLKEIHHRVKNNMQVISSLLSLQSKQIEDKQSLEMFRDSQNRVKSMALIHEKLYRSKDLARIDFAEYVQSLTSHLFNSYGINRAIKLETNIKDVLLDINTAIPCGLIINELVSNSLKHAFPNGNEGPSKTERQVNKISITINSDKEDKYTLIVSDNGVGFPKDLASRIQDTNTLGLKLVNTLVEQLDGSIELGNSLPSDSRRENGGTVFKITFKKQKYESTK